jgi:hypothetical protein
MEVRWELRPMNQARDLPDGGFSPVAFRGIH